MNTEEKKTSLRATYDAALRGEEFCAQEQQMLTKVRNVIFTAQLAGIGTAIAVVLVALVVTWGWDASGGLGVVVGVVLVLVSAVVGGWVAWRMLRGNIFEQALEDHRARSADSDGVKRTDVERRFLNSSFGVAQRLVDTVRNIQEQTKRDYDMAVAASGSTPDSASVGVALSRSYQDLNTLQWALEVDWQRNGIARPGMLAHVAIVTERVVAGMAACYPFVYRHVFVGRL